jgi:hypothetical protein
MLHFKRDFLLILLSALSSLLFSPAEAQTNPQVTLLCGGKGTIQERIKDCENYDKFLAGRSPKVIGVIRFMSSPSADPQKLLLYYHVSSKGKQVWAWPVSKLNYKAAINYCNNLSEGIYASVLKQFMTGDLEGIMKGYKFRLPGIDELLGINPLLNKNFHDIRNNPYRYYFELVEADLPYWTHNRQWDCWNSENCREDDGIPYVVWSHAESHEISGRDQSVYTRCIWSNRRKLDDDVNY